MINPCGEENQEKVFHISPLMLVVVNAFNQRQCVGNGGEDMRPCDWASTLLPCVGLGAGL